MVSTTWLQTAKALARLCFSAGSLEPLPSIITAHTPISTQSGNCRVFRLQSVYFYILYNALISVSPTRGRDRFQITVCLLLYDL